MAVVPRPKRATLGIDASSDSPRRSAASRAALITPLPISPGVVGDLARHTRSPSVNTQSVKVPPTSMPKQSLSPLSLMESPSGLIWPILDIVHWTAV